MFVGVARVGLDQEIQVFLGGGTAEVADKEPTVIAIWAISGLFCIVSFTLGRWRSAAALPALALAGLWGWVMFSEIHDPYVGPAILHELGRGYVAQAYSAALLPFLFMLVRFYMQGSNHRGAGDGGVASRFHSWHHRPAAPDHDR